jgi:hypothetical protein
LEPAMVPGPTGEPGAYSRLPKSVGRPRQQNNCHNGQYAGTSREPEDSSRIVKRDTLPRLSYCKRVIDTVEQVVTFFYMKSMVLAVVLTSAAFGQTTKTDIAIHCVSLPGDVVGGQLCSALRLAVARSPRYEEAVTNPQGWQLRLATMGVDDNKGTAVSMTLVYHAMYVVNTVQVCGASVIPDCAQGMLSDSDDHIRLLQKAVKDHVATQQIP